MNILQSIPPNMHSEMVYCLLYDLEDADVWGNSNYCYVKLSKILYIVIWVGHTSIVENLHTKVQQTFWLNYEQFNFKGWNISFIACSSNFIQNSITYWPLNGNTNCSVSCNNIDDGLSLEHLSCNCQREVDTYVCACNCVYVFSECGSVSWAKAAVPHTQWRACPFKQTSFC